MRCRECGRPTERATMPWHVGPDGGLCMGSSMPSIPAADSVAARVVVTRGLAPEVW